MEDTLFDVKNMNAYADIVWNESLTGSTKLIDPSLRTKPGKYDEEDSFINVVADKQKRDRYSKLYESLKKKIDAANDYDYDYMENFAYVPEDLANNEHDVVDEKILIQRRKKRESHKKFVSRMAVAIALSCGITSYVVGYTLINNPELIDGLKKNSTETSIVEERNIDVKAIAKKRLDALSLMYSNYVKKNSKLIYSNANGSRTSYNSNGGTSISYNLDGIVSILMEANKKSELEFRIALLAIAEEIGQHDLYRVLAPCIKEVGYDFFAIDDEEADREVIGPGYHSAQDYLQYESNNIYYDIMVDTENKINDGSIYVFPNGTFYEVGSNKDSRGRGV